MSLVKFLLSLYGFFYTLYYSIYLTSCSKGVEQALLTHYTKLSILFNSLTGLKPLITGKSLVSISHLLLKSLGTSGHLLNFASSFNSKRAKLALFSFILFTTVTEFLPIYQQPEPNPIKFQRLFIHSTALLSFYLTIN